MVRRCHRLLAWFVVFVVVGTAWLAGPLPSASAAGAPPDVNVQALGLGYQHSCAIRADGSVACWGSNNRGQTNAPTTGAFTQVDGGYGHTCALATDGSIACWGDNYYGQAPPTVTGPFTSLSAGATFTCGLLTTGKVTCWGDDSLGYTEAPSDTFTSISASERNTCGIRTNGTVACWGRNDVGQSSPPATDTFVQVSAGTLLTCGLHADGTAKCWGYNDDGQATPPAGTKFSAVSAGFRYACGISSPDGALVCWGYNGDGRATPPAGTFRAVSAADEHACAIRTDGTAVCWGGNGSDAENGGVDGNAHGELGAAPAVPAPTPPAATIGVPYSHTFTSGTGSPAGTFWLATPALPNGLTLSPDGVISGTPTNAATSTFTVAAYDGVFPTAKATFTITVNVGDTTAPTTTIALAPATPTGSNGWYTGPVAVTVSATDSGSGVDQTRCVLDPAGVPATFADLPAGCDLTSPVTGQGQHTVYAASKDKAGNTEAVRSASFRIDSVKPVLAPTLPEHVYLHQSGVTASPGATDATSGLATQSCDPLDTSTAGDHTLTCRATDNAGNQASVQVHYTVEYKILGLSLPLPGSSWRAGSIVLVTAALTDANGALIPTAEASALAKSCRFTFTGTGAQTTPAQCLAYEPITHQFYALWKTARTPTGQETVTVAVTYPGATTATTRSTTFTLTR